MGEVDEALLVAGRVPPAFLRMAQKAPFALLPDFDASLWSRVKAEADARVTDVAQGLVSGSDVDAQAVGAARRNLSLLPGGSRQMVAARDFRDIESLEGVTIEGRVAGLRRTP